MGKFGFKEITPDNWLEVDPTLGLFGAFDEGGVPQPLSDQDFLLNVLEPQLPETVTRDIRALFEVARGSMCYGWFFYPLYSLATQQLFRVVEAAVAVRCQDLGAGAGVSNFHRRIEFLLAAGAIAPDEGGRWDTLRRLRNEASHARQPHIFTPFMALDVLRLTAEVVSALFPAPA
jgi:hypothetical protein